MKFISVILSLTAVVATQAIGSKHSFDFKQFAQDVAAAKPEKSQRKLHDHLVIGRKHVGGSHAQSRTEDADIDDIMFSEECSDFALRMIDEYPELYYDDLLDIDLYACNALSYELMVFHYSAGINQTALEGEPGKCVDAFSEFLSEVVKYIEELHFDEAFCDYVTYLGSGACDSMNITDVEEALTEPWSPDEVTDVCTTGEALEVAVAFFETLSGPPEEDRCMFSMKQIMVDNKIDFMVLAANDPVCMALAESLEGKSGRGAESPPAITCLAEGMCL